MAASFTEADLLRFFNSLCETEASLREAAHPRYVLEIGLVKLIEMRSVATIESILKRLDAFTSGAPIPAKPQASGISFDDLIPKQQANAAPSAPTTGPAPALEPDASQRIASAGIQGAVEGFGHAGIGVARAGPSHPGKAAGRRPLRLGASFTAFEKAGWGCSRPAFFFVF